MDKYLKKLITSPRHYYIVMSLGLIAIFVTFVSLVYLSQWKANVKEYNEAIEFYNASLSESEDLDPSTTAAPVYRKPVNQKTDQNASENYLADLEKYAGRRVQMSGCLAAPNQMLWKNGTAVMFDNRNDFSIELQVDGKPATINALGYRIITFSSNSLPHTAKIDCYISGAPSYNIATISLVE